MKHQQLLVRHRHFVTPYAGVWIETDTAGDSGNPPKVTPYAGVWIETTLIGDGVALTTVTPYAGVWIET